MINRQSQSILTAARTLIAALAACAVIFVFQGGTGISAVSASNFKRLDFAPPQKRNDGNAVPGRFFLAFDGTVSSRLRREVGLPLAYIDILGGRIAMSPLVMPFADGPARLVRLTQLANDPPVVRATFFLRELATPHIRALGDTLEISFHAGASGVATDAVIVSTKQHAPQPYSLLEPGASMASEAASMRQPGSERWAGQTARDTVVTPIDLNLKGVQASHLLKELAKQAGMNVHFRDAFDSYIDVQAVASSPVEAMTTVVAKLGGTLSIEDGEIWISLVGNPLLAFSDTDLVEGADLRGLALGDVLRALGQIGELNIVLDKSLGALKDQPVDALLQRMTYRRAFETLLRLNELTVREIDGHTLLVQTLAASRLAAGNAVRVLPLKYSIEKVKNLLEKSFTPALLERVKLEEDLGNLVVIGDREAVEQVHGFVEALEGKIARAGESVKRMLYRPVNTKPEDLIKLATDSLGEKATPKMQKDDRTDTIVVSGSSDAVDRALALMKNLDRPRTRQAIIQVRLLELKRQDLSTLGLKVQATSIAAADISRPPTSVTLPADFSFDNTLVNAKTLANPTLRCMDKEEATIDISEQIPVKNTSTEYLPLASTTLAARTSDNWSTYDIGIKLTIKPHIHIDNEVTMDVNADFTELVKLVEGHPWTAKRNVKTRIRVKSSETVVIGGLIRRKNGTTRKPIPIIHKIPLLRKLVKPIEYRDNEQDETEMVILLRPHVVGSEAEKGSNPTLLPTLVDAGKHPEPDARFADAADDPFAAATVGAATWQR
ncbi:MAG TPA: hypothetical protein PLU72_01325 [Candidatus Ozemobacteraceae bacterium]|nr:hypothetical protein [Candidatus Ozemobacteraceae bacterium]